MSAKQNVFQFEDYRSYLKSVIQGAPRGFKTKLSSAMGCQGIYLIRALKGEAQLSEDQAFKAAEFLKLSPKEAEFLLDLVRLSKASDPKFSRYLKNSLQKRSAEMREVSKRVAAKDLSASLETRVEYYSSWRPSILHLATSCPHLATDQALSDRFALELVEVKKLMNFLIEAGLVQIVKGRYSFLGGSIHLPKGSPMQRVFQRELRSLVARTFDRQRDNSLHHSVVFATSAVHQEEIRSTLLNLIEKTHTDLQQTKSEDLYVLAIDFSSVV